MQNLPFIRPARTGMLLPLLCVALGALCLSGCNGSPSADAAKKVFNYVNVDEPKGLDPAFSYGVYDGIATGLLFDGLVNFTKGSEVQPGLAEKWEISDDGKTYTFHLRDARFSDGTTITATDVRHSITRVLRPETNSDRKWLFDRIVGADEVTSGAVRELSGLETPDEKTVVIRLKAAYPPFLTMLAMPSAAIVPVEASGKENPNPEFDKKPVGSGPWVLKSWTRDLRMEFVPNAHYWGQKPKIDQFNYSVQSDDTVQRQQFQIGKFDIYPGIGFTVFQQWNKDPKYRDLMIEVPELNTYFMGMTCTRPALQDKRVRQAVAHAIDSKGIFEKIQLGRGVHARGPVPAGIEGYRENKKWLEYNPEKAKQLLKEAGVENLTLSIWIRTEQQNDEVASAIQADLAKVGIRCDINKRDLSALKEAMNNAQPDLFLWSWWLDYPDIENALVPLFTSTRSAREGNRTHYKNPEVDRLFAQAQAEADPQKRIELFQQAEDLIIDDAPWVPLFHRKSYSALQPWVVGYKPSLMYNAERYTDVDIDLSKKK